MKSVEFQCQMSWPKDIHIIQGYGGIVIIIIFLDKYMYICATNALTSFLRPMFVDVFTGPLSPPLMPPDSDFVKPKKTPERVEFENSIDGLEEESEEELTEHNLRSSLSSDLIIRDEEEENMSDSDLEYVSSQWPSIYFCLQKGFFMNCHWFSKSTSEAF